MNDKQIWDFLYSKLGNPYGAAALLGNLYVESHLDPVSLQGSYSRKLKMSSSQYTSSVDSGSYKNFVKDGAGYGLAQWTYWSRKESLYNHAKSRNKSVGDLQTQLDFLWTELQTYKTCFNALKSASDIRKASDIVVEQYEKPADQSEQSRKTRADHGQQFFDKYFVQTHLSQSENESKKVVVTHDRVNIRSGNGKEFGRISVCDKGSSYDWIAISENGWYAIKLPKQVGWISSEFSKIKKGDT